MRRKRNSTGKPYKLVGAYDSETTNIYSPIGARAFPILHQLGITEHLFDVMPDNVRDLVTLHMFRHTFELTLFLDEYMAIPRGYVPVIACHNLSFDMWPLGEWLNSHHTRVLAKSRQKPITFTILDDEGNPVLVIWDTLVFSGQSLARMGVECGFEKSTGLWDYEKIRTPETELDPYELEYASNDIYTLIAWLSWWARRNPDIDPSRLGLNVVTKTGIVRERRRNLFDQLKGNGHRQNVGRYWIYQNRKESPKSDDELLTMHVCTRGGFVFCAESSASVPYDLRGTGQVVAGFDAVSMHPAQICAHRYPTGFHQAAPSTLTCAFELVAETSLDYLLKRFVKPFPVAFNARFRFANLRPRKDAAWAEWGIYPLASARFASVARDDDTDNETGENFKEHMFDSGYRDTALNPLYRFGKLISADKCELYLTELEAWIVAQVYDYDSVEAVDGYITGRFVRPTDMCVLSVMRFFQAKNVFKDARRMYQETRTIDGAASDALAGVGVAPALIAEMEAGTLSDIELDAAYQVRKSDLNALFGIEASNEYRQDTVLGPLGIEYKGEFGLACGPKNPKTWYQMGQRIVGWSRIAQTVAIMLGGPVCKRVINGDTDSVKFLVDRDRLPELESRLAIYSEAVDRAKTDTCLRVKLGYPRHYDELEGIGHYELEFVSECFCAAWNKAYASYDVDKRDGQRHFKFTLAGVPTARGLNRFADELEPRLGFSGVCDLVLGYNVTLAHNLTRLNARAFPEWGSMFDELIDGDRVCEPSALAIYPMAKTVNSTSVRENADNMEVALANRPSVNTEGIILSWGADGKPLIVRVGEIVGGS